MRHFIFDVDGTLTPSREPIDEEFSLWLFNFCNRIENSCYIATGSDYAKTEEQLGEAILMACERVYNCSGNDVWEKGKNIFTTEIEVPEPMQTLFDEFLNDSQFGIKTGNHVELRPGMINFSIVGRNATKEDRQAYIHWDRAINERVLLKAMLSDAFLEWDINVAGDTGIDIVPWGHGKEQILKDFNPISDEIYFFGDKMAEGGNDYKLAQKILASNNYCFAVKDWKDTWNYLKDL
jgi:HAD superfamily hydrolase (TIGR01484 family)